MGVNSVDPRAAKYRSQCGLEADVLVGEWVQFWKVRVSPLTADST
jgi:hypothetical protein